MFFKQEACNEIATDEEKDEDSGPSIEDSVPENGDMVCEFETLKAMEGQNKEY